MTSTNYDTPFTGGAEEGGILYFNQEQGPALFSASFPIIIEHHFQKEISLIHSLTNCLMILILLPASLLPAWVFIMPCKRNNFS